MSTLAIHTRGLTRYFSRIKAVDDLTLEVPEGAIYGFLGPNGAGKTTTLRLLLGLVEPTGGGGQVLGFDIRTEADRVRERCGTLLEHTGIYERLSAYDNLEFAGRVWHMGGAERKDRIREVMTKLELWDRRTEQAGKLSKGMKQKLAVARAIFHHPRLVFLDEPTSGLDAVSAHALREDITGLVRNEGITIFLTTHNLTEAEKLCDRVGVIRKGRLIFSGAPEELKTGTDTGRIEIEAQGVTDEVLAGLTASVSGIRDLRREDGKLFVTTNPSVKAAPIVEYLVRKGIPVEEVRKGRASLEEAFIEILENEGEGGKP